MRHQRGNLELARWAARLLPVLVSLLITVSTAVGQASTARSPSLEGPGAGTLNSVSSVGMGGSSAQAFASRGPTSVATVSGSGMGGGTGSAGYYASGSSAYSGARFSGGSLLAPIGGLSSMPSGMSFGGGGGRQLPLAVGNLYGQSAAVPEYMPFNWTDPSGPMAVPVSPPGVHDFSAVPAENQVEFGDVFQRQIVLRYSRVVERAWAQFRGGDYQAALHGFRSVDELARDLLQRDVNQSVTVTHGMMLAYIADKAYSAAGQQMLILLRRDPRLFDLNRRDLLKNYTDIEEFRQHRLRLREHIASGDAEPGMALALCYCVWLDGSAREALDMARSFARQVSPAQAAPYLEFVRRAEPQPNPAS